MVGIVLVSHSRALALAVQELVRSMTGPELPMALAAGVGENRKQLGTDAVEISEAITAVKGPEGALVLMDMGSAILSSETALDLLDEPLRKNVRFCAAPFVEGAVAAGVTASLGAPLEDVLREALAALKQKEAALTQDENLAVAPLESSASVAAASTDSPSQAIRCKVRNAHGLHARPAACLIRETRRFRAEITVRNLSNQRGPVSMRSLSSLASLEILQDNEIEVAASGEDAEAALDVVARLAREGFGESLSSDAKESASHPIAKPESLPAVPVGSPVPVSAGIALGRGVYFQSAKPEIPQDKIENTTVEMDRLKKAVGRVQKSLEERIAGMKTSLGLANAGIYEAQILALQDPDLIDNALQIIQAKEMNAAFAWDQAIQQIVTRYQSLQDRYLRERAADIEDVGRQVLEQLTDKKSPGIILTEPCILIADDLTPHDVSGLAKKYIQGVVLLDGGVTSHSSILLKSLGIPTVAQARGALSSGDSSHLENLAFDGSTGEIWINPDEALLTKLKNHQAEEQKRENQERQMSLQPGRLRDGERIEILANIGQVIEAEAALQQGAEGVGLLRTEFLFLDKATPPTEDDQFNALRTLADKMKDRPVTIRTLDVGGDKELPYLQMVPESNPFLGVRAIRLCFSHEELFATQLRAILRAGHGRNFRIMFPMIADVTDLKRALACLEKAHHDLGEKGVPHLWPVETGIMIEIPSAALQAEALAEQSHFFSVGTNDLVQYTLAADRGNPGLGTYQDALHPSVLRLIEMTVSGARKHGRTVAVCGESASDEIAAGIFIGLGVRELSMSGSKIPRLKAMLGKWKLTELQQQAAQALRCPSAVKVRALFTSSTRPTS